MQEFAPDTPGPVLLLPLILTFFGSLMFFAVRSTENRKGKIGWGRWVAAIPLFLGLWIGFKWFGKMYGAEYPWQLLFGSDNVMKEMYNASLLGMRNRLAHHAAFYIPLFMTGLAVVLHLVDRVSLRRRGPGAVVG